MTALQTCALSTLIGGLYILTIGDPRNTRSNKATMVGCVKCPRDFWGFSSSVTLHLTPSFSKDDLGLTFLEISSFPFIVQP